MARANTAIAAHHYPRLTIESADVFIFHRVTNNTSAAVAHDLHVELDRSDAFTPADLFHILKLVIRMCAATNDRDVRWSTHIGQTTRDVHRIVVTTTRNQYPDR